MKMKNIHLQAMVVIATILLTISLDAYSQSTNDRYYFKENIMNLDPIEGEYEVEVFGRGENAFRTFPERKETDETWTIVKKTDGKYLIREAEGDVPPYIERIGETNAYYYCRYWDAVGIVKTRFYMNNPGQFEIEFDIPTDQLKSDMGRDYQSGFRVIYRLNAIKSYPTASMYREAMEKAIRIEQEQRRQRETVQSSNSIHKNEPGNNLRKTLSEIKAMNPDVLFIKEDNGRDVYGYYDESTWFFGVFSDGICVEEAMMMESSYPDDPLPRNVYERMVDNYKKTDYINCTPFNNGYLFEYSYFMISVSCVHENQNYRTSLSCELK